MEIVQSGSLKALANKNIPVLGLSLNNEFAFLKGEKIEKVSVGNLTGKMRGM